MTLDDQTPVIIGAAQRNHREVGAEPIEMMADAALGAFADAGAATIADHVAEIRVVRGIWPYADPGALVAADLGMEVQAGHGGSGIRTGLTPIGGNEVYDLVAETAADIARGEADVVLICAAEHGRTRRRARREGNDTPYRAERDGAAPHRTFGTQRSLTAPDQIEAGAAAAVNFYALAESALRHELGHAPAHHREHLCDLWARAATVAGGNPHAWLPDAPSADVIGDAGPGNRMVADPYPKLMTSNIDVDQAAAVVMCSAGTAKALGIGSDRWVFPVAGAGAVDAWDAAERAALHRSPAMAAGAGVTLDHAGWYVDDVDLLDLYSCFPAAVQVGQATLRVEPDRAFTVTGGLTFAGGPLNSYCLHALARTVGLLRDAPDQRALLTGNGGYFTKHSFLALAGAPPARPFARASLDREFDRARPRADAAVVTRATIEAHTVVYDRDGAPASAIATVLGADGVRRWASGDAAVAADLEGTDAVGTAVDLVPGDEGAVRMT